MRLFDVRCTECNTESEVFVKSDNITPDCSCGGAQTRLIRPVRFELEGITGDFPTAYDQWAKKHEQAAKQARKENRDEF